MGEVGVRFGAALPKVVLFRETSHVFGILSMGIPYDLEGRGGKGGEGRGGKGEGGEGRGEEGRNIKHEYIMTFRFSLHGGSSVLRLRLCESGDDTVPFVKGKKKGVVVEGVVTS